MHYVGSDIAWTRHAAANILATTDEIRLECSVKIFLEVLPDLIPYFIPTIHDRMNYRRLAHPPHEVAS